MTSTSIDNNIELLIDDYQKLNLEIQVKDNTYYGYLISNEFSIFRDPEGQTRAMKGHILNISKEDIADIIAMNWSSNFFHSKKRSYDPPSIDEAATPSIDGHFESKRSKLHPNRKRKPRWENTDVSKLTVAEQYNYNKVEIDELVEEISRVIRTSDDYHSKRFDDIYYPFNNNISWLTPHTDEMKNLAMLQKQHGVGARRSKSIDTHTQTLIDASIQASIDAHFAPFEDRLQSFTYRLDGVYYPLRDRVDFLTTCMDALQQEMDTIQRQLDSHA